MKKHHLMKSILCLVMTLVCNVAWAQTATIEESTSADSPEHMYEIKSGSGYWMTSYTSPTNTNPGRFAFFATDVENAYKIYSIDQQKWVSYTIAASYSNGTNKATLVDTKEEANAWCATIVTVSNVAYYQFAPYKTDASIASIYANWYQGVGSNPLDNTSTTIGLYGTGASGDAGSRWTLYAYEAATEEEFNNAKNLIKVAPGYPKTSSAAYTMLNGLTYPVSKSFLTSIVTAYKTATDIILPEDGKAYTLTNVMGNAANATRYYMKYVAGQKVAVSKAESDASIFVCKELSTINANAKRYAFVTVDGKILTWIGNDEGGAYKENIQILGYSSNYATTYNNKADWNEITIKKNGTNADDLGYLRLVGRRNSSSYSSIIANKGNRFDQASDGYWFNSDNSSAWILTEVEHTNTAAQDLALAKIDAKVEVAANASKLGEGIGYAYYMAGETKLYTADEVNAAIDAAATIEDVTAIKNSFKYEVPEAGTPYALYDATHSVYLDIHNLGVEANNASYTQLATLNASKQFLYITGNEANGTWKIHTTLEGGNYLHQASGRAWNSWVSDAGSDFNWQVEPIVENEQLVYKLKNVSGIQDGYLGEDNHNSGNAIYVNIASDKALKLSLVSATPEVGKYYRIKGKTSGNYIDAVNCYNNSDQMGMKSADECNYLGTIFLLDEGNRLLNMGTNTYVHGTRHIGATKENANTWTFKLSSTQGYFTLTANGSSSHQLHDNTNRADRCSSICSDGTHDFIIEEVSIQALTIDAPVIAGASATWNGETKTLPAIWAVFEGMSITNPELNITDTNANYTFDGLYEGDEQVELPTQIASLTADRSFTAKFTPAFFSASTAEEDLIPVRIRNVRDNAYTLRLNANEDYTGKSINSGVTAYGENEIWYLVGTEQSFKIYNRVAGIDLHIVLAGTDGGSAASMNATGDNAEFCLVAKDNGYAICPKNNTDQSFNMHGGAGKDIKLYGSSDGGSIWAIEKMDVDNTLTFSVSIEGETWKENRGAGAITITVNDIAGKKNIEDFAGEQKYYLPLNGTFTIASDTYRGYTFTGFDVNGTTVETLANQTLTEDLDVEASYTANEEKVLYYTPDANGKPYRIPAIAAAPNGHIFAIADNRPCGNDIGYGEVDIKCRISKDNGVTWGEEFFIADGQGGETNEITTGYGDAAVVADRESNKLLVMMVCGKTVCHDGRWDKSKIGDTDATAVNRVARIYLTYNEETGEWDKSEIVEMTDHIYSLFLNGETPTVTSMFIGSGKICQSRVVKKDKYYRLYCSMWTRDGGNRVIYSDDFGGSWNVLGTINDRPASGGDEPKVEELADGTVVLSSRKYHGRYFNLFTFDNEGKSEDEKFTTGTWGTVVSSNDIQNGLSFGNNSTNGEIYKVKAMHKETGRVCDLMLQSIPTGDGRNNVAIYYKELNANTYTSTTIAQGWTKGKHVSYKSSCYSTMILQADGRIAFLFEEAPGGYSIVYIPYTIEDVTGGVYTSLNTPATGYYRFVNKDTSRKEYLYNDATLLGNTLRFTLQTDDVMTTNNGIWRLTKNAEDKLGVMNGDGNPIVAGASYGGSILGTYSELTIHTYKEGYYYFAEALNCSGGSNFTVGGVPFLTTWAGHPEASDNQWRLEPVSVEGKTIYEVVVDHAAAYAIYNDGTTVQNAFNGGFFITDGAITEAQLSAGVVGNVVKRATVTLKGNVIKVSNVETFAVPAKQDLYNTSNGSLEIPPYRIPGITVDPETGRIITTAARLVCGTDPGYGQVDVVCRISDNHGETWSEMKDVAVGTGITSPTENFFDTAFGDPAVVADRTSNEVLIIVVAGCTKYQTATRAIPNMIGTIHSTDNGNTWQTPVDITENIYSLFDAENGGNTIQSAFVGGGKVFQSRIVKVGDYYRLYAAMCARPNGNRVIYSDDFGRTWKALGGASALPAPGGDEPKCEEMPDGRVILSSRVGGGRIYNIYTYSNTATAEGSWSTSETSSFEGSGYDCSGGQSTNGEILIVPVQRNSDGKDMYLALQSLPTSGRNRVGIYYKELTDMTDINSVHGFATDWNGFYLVTDRSSAYSSMDLQNDNRIGFIYEENYTKHGVVSNPHSIPFPDAENLGTHNYDGYDNMYIAYELEYITNGAYSIKRDVDRRAYLQTYFADFTADAVAEVKDAVATNLAALSAEPTIDEVDKIYFTMSKGSAVTAFDENAGSAGFFTNEAVATYKAEVMAATEPTGLAAAKDKLLASKLNIISGKTYTFKNVQKDGTTMRWYKYDTTTGKIELAATEVEATPFVCRLLDNGKYVFVCNEGKYMTWRASVTGCTTTGVNDAYDGENHLTDITITKMTTAGNITGDLSATRYVSISANRPDRENEMGYVVVKKNSGNPTFDGAGGAFYNDNFSSAFIIEEVAYANTPKLNGVNDSELMSENLHEKYMGTFSAPFATIVPEGVTAYYGAQGTDGAIELMSIADGEAIPANQGVILVGDEEGNALMKPAASETAATIVDNALANSAGAAIADFEGYVLAAKDGVAGFYKAAAGGSLAMNKAYIAISSEAQALCIRLGKEEGTTNIEAPIANGQQPIAIYDLMGRRVEQMLKGNMYIVNGKKVIF